MGLIQPASDFELIKVANIAEIVEICQERQIKDYLALICRELTFYDLTEERSPKKNDVEAFEGLLEWARIIGEDYSFGIADKVNEPTVLIQLDTKNPLNAAPVFYERGKDGAFATTQRTELGLVVSAFWKNIAYMTVHIGEPKLYARYDCNLTDMLLPLNPREMMGWAKTGAWQRPVLECEKEKICLPPPKNVKDAMYL